MGFEGTNLRYEPDGNLVAEFLMMEEFWLASARHDNYDNYTCAAAVQPLLECLDIAGSSTLGIHNMDYESGTVTDSSEATVYDPETEVFHAMMMNNSQLVQTDESLFGFEQCGNASVGDGVVGAYDIAALLWYQFKATPYDGLPSDPRVVNTTRWRAGTALRCGFAGPDAGDVESRSDWMLGVHEGSCLSGFDHVERDASPSPPPLAPPTPPLAPPPSSPNSARRLSLNGETDVASALAELTEQSLRPGAQEMNGQVERWSSRVNGGLWLKVHAPGVQIATELFLTGLAPNPDRVGKLSNRQWPDKDCERCEPGTPGVQVRFARRLEYGIAENPEYALTLYRRKCSNMLPGFGGSIALKGNTLSLRQETPNKACAFDVFLWVPLTELDGSMRSSSSIPPVCIGRGSSSEGAYPTIQRAMAACDPAVERPPPSSMQSPPPPLPPLPPQASTSTISEPSSATGTLRGVGLISVTIAVLLLSLACGLGLVRYRRRNARSRSLATAGLTAPLGSASVLPPSDSSIDASQPSELGSESSAPSEPRRVEV